ncbi:MAG: nuclear transport factor 2 family protein [Candidatus Bathyarchaeia archaeon]
MNTQAQQDIITVIQKFNDATNKHDVEAMMSLMSNDCVFENTVPPPDGERFEGFEKIKEFWKKFFESSPQAKFETEEIFVAGNRCVVSWIYHWVDKDGKPGHVRGVDLFTVKNGKITEKLSYVQG